MTQESHPTSWLDEIPGRLADIERAHLLRRRRVVQPAGGAHLLVDGQPMLAFCSNDYLGLSQQFEVVAALQDAAGREGAGSTASPWSAKPPRPGASCWSS